MCTNFSLYCFRQQSVQAASDVTPDVAAGWNHTYLIIQSSMWVSEDPVTQRTDSPLCSVLTLDPSRLRCQPTGCQHWPSFSHALRHRTGQRVGRVMCLCLSDSHTHIWSCSHKQDLTYTPRLENSFNACKCRAFHCNVSLWGQLCPSELPWASENRHHQPHSLGCYF